ncbi:hypothetical protein D9613_010722 [Agrocybe pediades]|uniref:Uncharacterized protein n=1 Tax=Agrocybe pediades TaxID=84607 RepID=A0A8H4QLC6_9AGAR|nr:hypothetical protein D9613_010722 [Agrocybe pediades]
MKHSRSQNHQTLRVLEYADDFILQTTTRTPTQIRSDSGVIIPRLLTERPVRPIMRSSFSNESILYLLQLLRLLRRTETLLRTTPRAAGDSPNNSVEIAENLILLIQDHTLSIVSLIFGDTLRTTRINPSARTDPTTNPTTPET